MVEELGGIGSVSVNSGTKVNKKLKLNPYDIQRISTNLLGPGSPGKNGAPVSAEKIKAYMVDGNYQNQLIDMASKFILKDVEVASDKKLDGNAVNNIANYIRSNDVNSQAEQLLINGSNQDIMGMYITADNEAPGYQNRPAYFKRDDLLNEAAVKQVLNTAYDLSRLNNSGDAEAAAKEMKNTIVHLAAFARKNWPNSSEIAKQEIGEAWFHQMNHFKPELAHAKSA